MPDGERTHVHLHAGPSPGSLATLTAWSLGEPSRQDVAGALASDALRAKPPGYCCLWAGNGRGQTYIMGSSGQLSSVGRALDL